MKRNTRMVVVALGTLAVASCSGGSSSGGVQVTRQNRPGQDFSSVNLVCTAGASATSLRCVHGDPANTGLEVELLLSSSIADRPAGTTLTYGTDFQVTGIAGASEGAPWGASGNSGWWMGDLTIALMARSGTGQAAVFNGTMRTTAAAATTGLAAITVVFNMAAGTVP